MKKAIIVGLMVLLANNVYANGLKHRVKKLEKITIKQQQIIEDLADRIAELEARDSGNGDLADRIAELENKSLRFADMRDGTIRDNRTGLYWLINPTECIGLLTYPEALDRVAALADGVCGLTDGSEPGRWRIPTIEERRELFDGRGGNILTNANGNYDHYNHPNVFVGIQDQLDEFAWSSTFDQYGLNLYVMAIGYRYTTTLFTGKSAYVLAVRD